ncbi:MAG TPA: O-antigen ligase family protein [Gallionella sp.]
MTQDFKSAEYASAALLIALGGILATPLAAGPLVLLALIATIMMLARGRRNGMQRLGEQTVAGRNMLMMAFGGWFLAEFISTAVNNQHWQNLDYPLRFLLAIGVFWIIRNSALRRINFFIYAIAASAIAAGAMSYYQHYVQGMDRVLGWTNIPIYFGNLSVLLCVFAVIVLAVMRQGMSKRMRGLLFFAIPLLVAAAFLSGSRSSWLGMLALLVLVDWRRANYVRLLGGGLIVATGLAVLFALMPELTTRLRLAEATHDFQRILDGNFASSIGYRLQMWWAALMMFWSSPLIGIGSNEFQGAMANLMATGTIEPGLFRGETNFNQAHSEIMDVLATKGVVGLSAYIALLVLPYRFLGAISKSPVAEARAFALMGQATLIAFLLYGLTLATFKVQIYCAVFPAAVAIFTAMALNYADSGKAGDSHD